MKHNRYLLKHLSPASQAQIDFRTVTPGSGFAIAWGYTLSSSFAGWLNAFVQLDTTAERQSFAGGNKK